MPVNRRLDERQHRDYPIAPNHGQARPNMAETRSRTSR